MSTAGASLRALDRLKKAANLVPVKRIVILSDGAEFEFWSTPLTMAERESGCSRLVNWPSLKTMFATKTYKG